MLSVISCLLLYLLFGPGEMGHFPKPFLGRRWVAAAVGHGTRSITAEDGRTSRGGCLGHEMS